MSEPQPVVTACPDDLIPLVTQNVEQDAATIFRILWKTIGEWHLEGILDRPDP
jgi:hypothetical protein